MHNKRLADLQKFLRLVLMHIIKQRESRASRCLGNQSAAAAAAISAIVATSVVASAAVVVGKGIAVAAAGEQEDKNDNPIAVVTAHKMFLLD